MIKNKGILCLFAIIMTIALLSVACKKKVTAPSFSEGSSEEEVVTPEEPKPTEGTFSKYSGSYISQYRYDNNDGKGAYQFKAVLDGDNVTLYKVYVDSGKEDKWEVGKRVDGTLTIKGSWMTFSFIINGNQIILNLPFSVLHSEKVYINKI